MRRVAAVLLIVMAGTAVGGAQEQPVQFGGSYAGLDARRRQLVDDWVARFVKTSKVPIEPGKFYDDVLGLSAKTTFEAVTHALMTTTLADDAGGALGDALSLVGSVDTIRGEVDGAAGDRQFRMYVRLTDGAIDLLGRSRQFKRGVDNTVYHKGYPINYRAEGGVPSIQISISTDKRRADIDVDYRASGFPLALFNGHLTSSNSDVRAGNNFDRHLNRWSGFQNWWNSFFGVRHEKAPDTTPAPGPFALPKIPRTGKANIDTVVEDFLKSWLLEGNIVTAMGYVSERSYACLAREMDDPTALDRGVAPFQLMLNLKAAYEALGPHSALDGLVVGTRLALPGLRVVRQPHHAQFVIYGVPNDMAASLDCENWLTLGDPATVRRAYGSYFGATFYVNGQRDTPVALLWGRDGGYWKIVSWKIGVDNGATPQVEPVASPQVVRVAAEPALVTAARGFLDSWLIRHDYDAAFKYIAPQAYGCYNLERSEGEASAATSDEAARALRAGLEAAGKRFGTSRGLADILSVLEPAHPVIRVMNHRDGRIFGLASIPDAFADASECAARAGGVTIPDPVPLNYGNAFGMTVRFKTLSGEPPVLRLLWRRENGAFRITSYAVEMP